MIFRKYLILRKNVIPWILLRTSTTPVFLISSPGLRRPAGSPARVQGALREGEARRGGGGGGRGDEEGEVAPSERPDEEYEQAEYGTG